MDRISEPTHGFHIRGFQRCAPILVLALIGLFLVGPGAWAQVSLDASGGQFRPTSGLVDTTAQIGGLYALQSDTIGRDRNVTGWRTSSDDATVYKNTAAGYKALFSNTTGFANTAVGRYALTENTIGQANTAIGRYALSTNTIGSNNTATGQAALASNTSGYSNSAHGQAALYSNTTGSQNTASGYQALYSNTTAGNNTAIGYKSLHYNTIGLDNTASGTEALFLNTTGHDNTASGAQALYANTTGFENTAIGRYALSANTVGHDNAASGHSALYANTVGHSNTANGSGALFNNTLGNHNIAVGHNAGYSITTGHHNIMIGSHGDSADTHTIRIGYAVNQSRTFIAGIRGQKTGQGNAIPVVIDSDGQLGTVPSSGRYKEDVHPMADRSAALGSLRPVTFRYKQAFDDESQPVQYGLIAEEVAEVFPDLVVFNEAGQPEAVKYHILSSLLVNEFQRLSARHEALRMENDRRIAGVSRLIEDWKSEIAAIKTERNREMAAMEESNTALRERVLKLEGILMGRPHLEGEVDSDGVGGSG